MIRSKLVTLEDLGIDSTVALGDLKSIPSSSLPILTRTSELRMPDKSLRAHLYLKHQISEGSFGEIRMATRVDLSGIHQDLLVKSPRLDIQDIKLEAIIQHSAYTCLIANRVPWAIPAVYDIFRYGKKTMFSMEYIAGYYLDEWFTKTKQPDTDFLYMMAQLSIYLCILHQCLGLDHRDLKADNLLISPHPCRLRFQYKTTVYAIDSPFRLHMLDFGFACLGDSEPPGSNAFLTLGDVLPVIDPCPKEGRDLFQLLLSLLCIRAIRLVISHTTLASIERWTGKEGIELAEKSLEDIRWIYLKTSRSFFTCPTSTPYNILRDILTLAPELFTQLP